MKKIISVVLLLSLCLSFAINAEGNLKTYTYVDGDIEIQIQHTNFTDEEHKIEAGIASITHHHVYPTYPYCEITYYYIEMCERCDYETSTIESVERIGCCTD